MLVSRMDMAFSHNGTNATVAPTWSNQKFPEIVRFTPEVEIMLIALYMMIAMVGLLFNGIICYLFMSRRLKKNAFHEYLLSLTISDILSILSCFPYILADPRKYNMSSKSANILCSFTDGLSLFWVCTCASVCILCLISFNRYLLINHPRKWHCLRGTTFVRISLVVSWILSLLFLSPNAFSYRFDKKSGICVRDWPESFNGTLYTYASTAFGVGIPLITMLYTLITTIKTLWFGKGTVVKNGAVIRARKRVIIMLLTLITCFILCWFPFAIYWLLAGSGAVFDEGINGDYQRHRVIRIVITFAMCNPLLDPLIYGLRSYEIRRALRSVLKREKVDMDKSIGSLSDLDSRKTESMKSRSMIVRPDTMVTTKV